MQAQAVVYWIHLPEHTDPKTEGYLGVSKRFESRMKDHFKDIQEGKHKNTHLVNAVNKYGWDNLIKEALYTGDESSCYELEENYRTSKAIGWNIAPGGHRGPGWPSGKKKSKKSVEKQKATVDKKYAADRENKLLARRLRLEEREQKRQIKINAIQEKRKLRVIKVQEKEEKIKKQLLERERRLKKQIEEGAVFKVVLKDRPICSSCNKEYCAINYRKLGIPHYRSICDECGRKKNKLKPRTPKWKTKGYKKKTICDLCGFKGLFTSQITVFHIDGNLENTDLVNLRSICLNCVEVVKKKEVNWKRGDLEVDH